MKNNFQNILSQLIDLKNLTVQKLFFIKEIYIILGLKFQPFLWASHANNFEFYNATHWHRNIGLHLGDQVVKAENTSSMLRDPAALLSAISEQHLCAKSIITD